MSFVIDSAFRLVSGQLGIFANQDNFWGLFDVAFGKDYNQAVALRLRSQWQLGDFTNRPAIEVVSSSILGGANGAYAAGTNTIYLADAYVSKATTDALVGTLLEEYGHFVDAQVNQIDATGDEGELFSDLVRGVSLSAAELNRINAEDDHGIMSLGDQLIAIERAAPTILTVTTTADQNNGVTTDGLSLREAILIANANPNTDYEILLTGGLTYNLTANGVNEDGGLTGDLDIASRNNILYIVSIGTQKATINASNLLNSDRVFDVRTNGRLSLQNVVVTGGLVGEYKDGGGIYVESTGVLDLYNTTVSNNSSGGDGGGIYNLGTTYLRNGSIISENIATGSSFGSSGGGIQNIYGATLTIMDSSINNNSASGSGGGIYNYSSTLFAINSTISNNTSGSGGGGINSSSTSSVALVNTTVSGNSSSYRGGGIYNEGSVLNIRNSTITNNTTPAPFFSHVGGGGIKNGSGTVNLRNTIVAGNFLTVDPDGNSLGSGDLSGTFSGNNNNLIGTLTDAKGTIGTGTDIVNANVQLSPLQNNGGLTLTHIPLSGSPAIDAGNNNQIPVDSQDLDGDGDTTEQLPFDARNLARISDGTVDIGAVEVQSSVALPSITLAVSPTSVLEDGTPNLIYTFTRTGATTSALTVNYGLTGTADNTDFTGATTGTGKTITFAANSSTATLIIDPTADTLVEANETVVLTLASGTGYTIGTTTAVTGTITNDDIVNSNDFQQITSLSNLKTKAGQTLSVPLFYNTSNSDNTLTGIGLRLHYNSSSIAYKDVTNLFSNNIFGTVSDAPDTANFDSNASTDRFVQLQYVDVASNWPNQTLPVKLGDFNFTAQTGFNGTQLNVTSPDGTLATGYSLKADPLLVTKQTWNLDIDGDGKIGALSDGIMAIRYLFGSAFSGNALTNGAISPTATRNLTEIQAYLQEGVTNKYLDIDGNGSIGALSDGIMAVRYMFGSAFSGNALIAGAIAPDATRDLAGIQSYMSGLTTLA